MWFCLKYFLLFLNIIVLFQEYNAKLFEPGEEFEKPIQYGCVDYEKTVELLTRVKLIETTGENILFKLNNISPGTTNNDLSLKDFEKLKQNINENIKSSLESHQKPLNNENFRFILETINDNLKLLRQGLMNVRDASTNDESVGNNFLQSLETENRKLTENIQIALTKILQQQNSQILNTMNNQSIDLQVQLAELNNNLRDNLLLNISKDFKNTIVTENGALINRINENSKHILSTLASQRIKCDNTDTKSELQDFIKKSIQSAFNEQQKLLLESLQKQPKGENLKFSEKYLATATGICNAKNGLPENCEEALRGNPKCGEGVYLLYVPNYDLEPFFAYCLPDYTTPSLPSWTIIQKRQNGLFNFNRSWNDYRDGFGDVKSTYWLGLKYIHAMTSRQNYELWADMEDWEGAKRYATYDKFVVGSEKNKFPLSLLGRYGGNAGDSLSFHIGQKFTTIDSDNDERKNGNCAKEYAGGWWFADCHVSNPNGIYNSTEYAKARL